MLRVLFAIGLALVAVSQPVLAQSSEPPPSLTVALRPSLSEQVEGLAPIVEMLRATFDEAQSPYAPSALGIDVMNDVDLIVCAHRVMGDETTFRITAHGRFAVDGAEAALDTAETWQRESGTWVSGEMRLQLEATRASFVLGADRPLRHHSECATCVVELRYEPTEAERAAYEELEPLRSVELLLDVEDHTLRLRVALRADASGESGAAELGGALRRAAAMPEVAALGLGPVLQEAQVTGHATGAEVTLPATGPAWSSLMEMLASLVEEELR